MDPGTLIVAALAVGAVAIVSMAITWARILGWFRGRSKIMNSYPRAVGFTIAERINGNEYTVIHGVIDAPEATTVIVQGIYDLDNGQVIDARLMKNSDPVTDQMVINAHNKGSGLVIYE
jgi:hypothetical protein